MKVKAFRKCFVGGSLYEKGDVFDVKDEAAAKAIKHVAEPLPKNYVEPNISERQVEADEHAAHMEAAAYATSPKGVIERTNAGKDKKPKPELPGGQAPTAKVTEVGSQ